MSRKIILPEKKIIELYINKKIKSIELSRQFKVSVSTINRLLKKYNIKTHNPSFYGYKPSEETKKKISNKLKGRSPWNKGKKASLSSRRKASKTMKGRVFTKEHLENIKKNHVRGKNHPFWNGGFRKDKQGYIMKKMDNHPYANKKGYFRIHRIVMEKWLRKHNPTNSYLIKIKGKLYLKPKVVVHHIDKNVENNTINNLSLFKDQAEHQAYHKKEYWKKWRCQQNE